MTLVAEFPGPQKVNRCIIVLILILLLLIIIKYPKSLKVTYPAAKWIIYPAAVQFRGLGYVYPTERPMGMGRGLLLTGLHKGLGFRV